MKRVLFIAAGPYYWGSSRMRCYWVAEKMKASVIPFDDWKKIESHQSILDEFDVFIFQKYGDIQMQEEMLAQGKRVFYDVCDPMWWFSPNETREIIQHVTGVVASSEALAHDFRDWDSGVKTYIIPDTIKLEHFPVINEHHSYNPTRFIWYGVAVNRVSLAAAWANLTRLRANGYKVQLTIFDDRPDVPLGFGDEVPIYYMRWDVDLENEIIASHDVALLPPYPGPWGAVKSNNKILTAWACGLPAIDGQDYNQMLTFLGAQARNAAGQTGRTTVENKWHIGVAAAAWQDLIDNVH